MSRSYRGDFAEGAVAEDYDRQVFSEGSYASLLWEIERRYLDAFLHNFPVSAETINYLDFACGTGRVLAFVAPKVESARGVEVSPEMAIRARRRAPAADVVQADITEGTPVEGRYDLITAFRFFLNAEPSLRLGAMQALAARLSGPHGRIVFNVHAHIPSHKLLTLPYRRLSGRGGRWNYVTRRDTERLLAEAGLEIDGEHGYDFLSAAALRLVPYERLLAIEGGLAGKPLVQWLGAHRLYVARLRG